MTKRALLVNVVLFRLADDTLQVLLTSPLGAWELPGAELSDSEGLEQAAERAISGLLDRRKTYIEQLFTYGADGGSAVRVVYFAICPAEANLLLCYVIGRWQLFAKSGYARDPLAQWPQQWGILRSQFR